MIDGAHSDFREFSTINATNYSEYREQKKPPHYENYKKQSPLWQQLSNLYIEAPKYKINEKQKRQTGGKTFQGSSMQFRQQLATGLTCEGISQTNMGGKNNNKFNHMQQIESINKLQ